MQLNELLDSDSKGLSAKTRSIRLPSSIPKGSDKYVPGSKPLNEVEEEKKETKQVTKPLSLSLSIGGKSPNFASNSEAEPKTDKAESLPQS